MKNILKATLGLLNGALVGLPVPGKGVINILIELIKVAEVREYLVYLRVPLIDV